MFGVQLLLGSPGWQNEDELLQKRRRGSRWVIGHPGESWQQEKAGKLICFLNTVYTNWLDFFEADVCPGLELESGFVLDTQMFRVFNENNDFSVYSYRGFSFFLSFNGLTAHHTDVPLWLNMPVLCHLH